MLLIARAGRDGEKYRFLLKFLSKRNDFDCPGWPGAAGMEKSIDFHWNSFQKATILIAQAGRERPGLKKELNSWKAQGSILILGGKAYKNLRRKGGEKYREVYLRWVAKPIEKIDRKSEKSNKKVWDLAKITKFLKFPHSKTMDLARKPIEK